MNDSIVYFILDTYSNAVKIGFTTIKGLKRRLQNLQIGTPYELRLLGALWGNRNVERQIHEQFETYHIRGEWFEYSKELEEYIGKSWDFSIVESLENKMQKKLINKPNEVDYGKQF